MSLSLSATGWSAGRTLLAAFAGSAAGGVEAVAGTGDAGAAGTVGAVPAPREHAAVPVDPAAVQSAPGALGATGTPPAGVPVPGGFAVPDPAAAGGTPPLGVPLPGNAVTADTPAAGVRVSPAAVAGPPAGFVAPAAVPAAAVDMPAGLPAGAAPAATAPGGTGDGDGVAVAEGSAAVADPARALPAQPATPADGTRGVPVPDQRPVAAAPVNQANAPAATVQQLHDHGVLR